MYNKWQSRRWWVCIWAILMCTALLVWAAVFDKSPGWMGIAISLFQLIIGGYIAADSMTKPKG